MRKQAVFRIRCITAAVLLVALIIIGRLYQIQILQGSAYTEKAERQYVHTSNDLYNRGAIYLTTRDGEHVSAASIRSGYILAANPTLITNPEAAFEALQKYIEVSKEEFLNKSQRENRTYIEISETIPEEYVVEIEALDIPGISLYRNQWRYYPGNELAARTIGFVGFSDKTSSGLAGKYGLERQYNEILERDNSSLSVNFFAEIFSNLGDLVFDRDKTKSGDLITTIEPTVSRMLDKNLSDTHEKWGSKLTGGIIMNPKNGEIYAMNAVPTFNLNDRSGVEIAEFKNPLVDEVYELGSIIKAFTMAAGIDAGAVTPETTYYDAGFIELDTFTISNYDGRGRGTVSMQEVLNQSLNTGVSFVVDTMGKEKFKDYFINLKLGSESGIDLPGEVYGLIDNLNSPRQVEYATASFGQGVAFTPIATTRALAALGNGGFLVTPHIVSSIRYTDGTEKEIVFPEGKRVFKESTSEDISRMLSTVVDDALRGGDLALPNHTIAAKTGTAQIANHGGGGYYDDKFLHSFFGYFPAYDPEFIIFLYTVEPKDIRYASETLTDPFMELATFLINYYDIPPDR